METIKLSGAKVKDPAMHLAFGVDAKYMPWFGVALTSILYNNPAANLHVHVVVDGMQSGELERLQRLADLHCISMYIYRIDETELRREVEGLPTHQHLSLATYFRLLLPKVLPKSVSRVLYLDSDILVLGALAELYQTDLVGLPLGAVTDEIGGPSFAERIGCPGKPYFNAGVLLVDLDKWRELHIMHSALSILRLGPQEAFLNDQDALNKLLCDGFLPLHSKWNSFVNGVSPAMNTLSKGSVIVHFVDMMKPWLPWYDGPLKDLYLTFLLRSPWSEASFPGPSNTVDAIEYAKVLSRNGRHDEATRIYDLVGRVLHEEVAQLRRRLVNPVA